MQSTVHSMSTHLFTRPPHPRTACPVPWDKYSLHHFVSKLVFQPSQRKAALPGSLSCSLPHGAPEEREGPGKKWIAQPVVSPLFSEPAGGPLVTQPSLPQQEGILGMVRWLELQGTGSNGREWQSTALSISRVSWDPSGSPRSTSCSLQGPVLVAFFFPEPLY